MLDCASRRVRSSASVCLCFVVSPGTTRVLLSALCASLLCPPASCVAAEQTGSVRVVAAAASTAARRPARMIDDDERPRNTTSATGDNSTRTPRQKEQQTGEQHHDERRQSKATANDVEQSRPRRTTTRRASRRASAALARRGRATARRSASGTSWRPRPLQERAADDSGDADTKRGRATAALLCSHARPAQSDSDHATRTTKRRTQGTQSDELMQSASARTSKATPSIARPPRALASVALDVEFELNPACPHPRSTQRATVGRTAAHAQQARTGRKTRRLRKKIRPHLCRR